MQTIILQSNGVVMAFFSGFFLGLSLIMSIGMQNLFLIRQGLRREHAWQCALVLSIADMLMVLFGATSVAHVLLNLTWLRLVVVGCALLFLLYQSGLAFRRGWRLRRALNVEANFKSQTRRQLLMTGLAFSFFNPAAVVETMFLVGSVVTEQPLVQQMPYTWGVVASSYVWFFGIALLAIFFARVLYSVRAWRCIEYFSGCILLLTSLRLGLPLLSAA